MVLVTTEAFSREVYAIQAPQQPSKEAKRHHSMLLISTCDVDSVCCCHMLQVQAWARSHFNDRQYSGRDVAVDLVFVRSAADALAWLDRQLEVSSGKVADLRPTYLSQDIPRGDKNSIRLPYYERIFLIGFGASSDGDGTGTDRQMGLMPRLYAAITDVLLDKAVQQRAWDDVRERHGLRGAHITLEHLPEEIRPALREERQAREVELRRDMKVVVLDSRRPVHQVMMQEEQWLLLVDEAEVEALQTAASLRAAGAPSRGHHYARPCALLLAMALPPLYPIEGSIYAYVGSISAAAFLHLDRVTSDEYNDWILAVREVNASSFPFVEDDSNGGLLPLLRNGCLEDSLRMCPELLFKHHRQTVAGWMPWHQRLQQLSNQLRVSCGIECRDMQHYFNGLSARQQQTVFGYLRQTLSLPDRLCLNWIRHTDHAKHRGTFSSVPNADAAWLLGAVLSKSRGDGETLVVARANATDALQLLKCLTTASITEKATALQLLQEAQQLLKSHLAQLYLQVDLLRFTVAHGLVLVTVKNPPPCLLNPLYLRSLCLLAALRQGGGNTARRLPVVLLCTSDSPSHAAIYCCTPGSDRHSPDLFPEILVAAEGLSGTSESPMVKRDPQDTYLLHVAVPRVGVDVQRQIAVLYSEALKRREEADADEDYLDNLHEQTADPSAPTAESTYGYEPNEGKAAEEEDYGQESGLEEAGSEPDLDQQLPTDEESIGSDGDDESVQSELEKPRAAPGYSKPEGSRRISQRQVGGQRNARVQDENEEANLSPLPSQNSDVAQGL